MPEVVKVGDIQTRQYVCFPESVGSMNYTDYKSFEQDVRIVFGDVKLSGNCLPITDVVGGKIEGEFTSEQGLLLKQNGTNLEIFSAEDFSKKVIVENYPFNNSNGVFGITLGKTADLFISDSDKTVSKIGYNEVSRDLAANNTFYSPDFFKTKDDGFFTVVNQGNDNKNSLVVAKFSNVGDATYSNVIEVDNLIISAGIQSNKNIFQYSNTITNSISSIYPFCAESADKTKTAVGFAVITDNGELVKPINVIAEYSNSEKVAGIKDITAAMENSGDSSGNIYLAYEYTKSGVKEVRIQEVDKVSFQAIDDWYRANAQQKSAYSASQKTADNNDLNFSNGYNLVKLNQTQNQNSFNFQRPNLIDIPAEKLILNNVVDTAEFRTDENANKQIVTLSKNTNGVFISQNDNSTVMIHNLEDAKLYLPKGAIESIKVYNANGFENNDLLNGVYDTEYAIPVPFPKDEIKEIENILGGEEGVKDYLKAAEENSAIIKNSRNLGGVSEEQCQNIVDELNLPTTSTLVTFLNQTLALPGVNSTELVNNIGKYIGIDYTTNPPTVAPTAKTGNPTGQPSTNSPSNQPTNKPVTNEPTSSSPSNQPTNKPITNEPTSSFPFTNEPTSSFPSGQPTFESSPPSGAPSFGQTNKPTTLQTANNSLKPTVFDTYLPTLNETFPPQNTTFPSLAPSSAQPTNFNQSIVKSSSPSLAPSSAQPTNEPYVPHPPVTIRENKETAPIKNPFILAGIIVAGTISAFALARRVMQGFLGNNRQQVPQDDVVDAEQIELGNLEIPQQLANLNNEEVVLGFEEGNQNSINSSNNSTIDASSDNTDIEENNSSLSSSEDEVEYRQPATVKKPTGKQLVQNENNRSVKL